MATPGNLGGSWLSPFDCYRDWVAAAANAASGNCGGVFVSPAAHHDTSTAAKAAAAAHLAAQRLPHPAAHSNRHASESQGVPGYSSFAASSISPDG